MPILTFTPTRTQGEEVMIIDEEKVAKERQEILDRFYFQNGPCCAGCDWWRAVNGLVGECTRNAPIGATERWEMLGMRGCSAPLPAGHVLTFREHVCGDFKDEFDWESLPEAYLKKIGYNKNSPGQGSSVR